MCGINGLLRLAPDAPPLDPGELRRARDAMAARGPDGAGLWLSPGGLIGLGHRRLAILDLSEAGAQPMLSPDGRYAIVFNGEIYNFRELRSELQRQGTAFRSQSDTEVLLELFAREDVAMLGRLRGMFALAIWDERERRLVLARDSFGIKPLYYAVDRTALRFASQVKSLEAAGVSREVDPVGLAGFLLWGSVPGPWTIRKAVRAVPAGHWLEVREGRVGGPTPFATRLAGDISVAESLTDSVRAHLVSDVPVGVFLSAGLDSALIAALAQRASPRPLRSFTLAFDSFRGTQLDEAPGAAELARALGTVHTERRVSQAELEAAWPEALAAMDQPSIDGFNVFLVSRFARQAGLKVVLSGLGGDELFGSYPSFRDVPRWHRWARICGAIPGLATAWRSLAPLWRGRPKARGFLTLGSSLEGAYFLRRGLMLPEELADMLGPQVAREALQAYDPLADVRGGSSPGRAAWEAVHSMETRLYLRNQLLRDADWASMAHSLELRVPLVDVRLHSALEHAAFEPARSAGKAALFRQVAPELPLGVLGRAKSGFMVPARGSGVAAGPWGRLARRLAREVLTHFGIEVGPARDELGGTLFLLPEAFHRPGGIQTHNRTQIQAVRRCRPHEPLTVLVLNDAPQEVEPDEWRALRRRGFARDRWRFALAALVAAWQQRPKRVILGHRNFLPLAPLLRAASPDSERWLLTYGIEAEPRLSALEWWCLASCGRVFAISPHTASTFREAGAQARIEVWPCSLPWDWPLPEPSPPQLTPPYRLLTVSRLAPLDWYKGIDHVIQAVAILRRRGLPVLLDIVGDGADRKRLEALAAHLGASDLVRFHAQVSSAELRHRYVACDLFVLPSAGEGFGIVYLEALSHARPVIAANAAGAPFVVQPGRTGWLVPFRRPDLLAQCIAERLLEPGATTELAGAGREITLARFSFQAHCAATAAILDGPTPNLSQRTPQGKVAIGTRFRATTGQGQEASPSGTSRGRGSAAAARDAGQVPAAPTTGTGTTSS